MNRQNHSASPDIKDVWALAQTLYEASDRVGVPFQSRPRDLQETYADRARDILISEASSPQNHRLVVAE